MAAKKQTERVVRTAAPLPPILVGARARSAGTHFEFWLSLFLRCVALVWIAEGVLQWLAVLSDDGGTMLAHASPLRVAALFFFCVLDFVAAVGLWLVTTWGAAVWIVTMIGHGLVAAFAPGFLPEPATVLASDLLLLAAYAALTVLAGRRPRPTRGGQVVRSSSGWPR